MRAQRLTAAILVTLAAVGLTACNGSGNNQTEFVDKFGRVCTQVDPPGEAIALDCDYPQSPSPSVLPS